MPILTLYFSRRWSADRIDFDKLKSQSNSAKSSKKEEVDTTHIYKLVTKDLKKE